MRVAPVVMAVLLETIATGAKAAETDTRLDQRGTLWFPCLEWTLENPDREGNPFDLSAKAAFVHENGERIVTGMYYDGGDRWSFRFSAPRTGVWTFETQSADPDLNGISGKAVIEPNPDPAARGFVTSIGGKWGWSGSREAFVPQLAMFLGPHDYHNRPERIDDAIQTQLRDHGFNGFHTVVLTRWFDLDEPDYDGIASSDPSPDPRTFEALENLIVKTYTAGGMVHIWAWGDEQRHQTPVKWGKNGEADKRLQRYIAARLGPLPGWTMGYGFDLFEWVDEEDLREWHTHMHAEMGRPHLLGGRPGGPRKGLDHGGWQIYEGLDYASYEHHRPTYEVYAAALDANPGKPVFSEDRFRIRSPSRYPEKDYEETLTRRGLWHSTMAGGVANIWGNLIGSESGESMPYNHPHWIKTWSRFFESRFLPGLERENAVTDGVCLRDGGKFIVYKEDTDSIRIDLTSTGKSLGAVAVDALEEYREIPIGTLEPRVHVWEAPRRSDWALAIGDFSPAPAGIGNAFLNH